MDSFRPWRAVASLACGHGASLAVVAAALVFRLPLDRTALQWGAAALLLLLLALACWLRKRRELAASAGMAVWSFFTATAHGAGMALLPALMPACGGGVLLQVLAATALHMAAMLAANGALAYLACCLSAKVAGAWRAAGLRA